MHKLFVEIGWDLANHADSQVDYLPSFQWWERPKELARTAIMISILLCDTSLQHVVEPYLASAKRSSLIMIS